DPPRDTARDLVARVRQTVTPEDTVRTAQRLMAGRGVDELVVVDDADLRRVVGIVTSADVLLAYNRRMVAIEQQGAPEAERASSPPATPAP
ncbi:MAG TPA: CBS domain-containing protein, partial [Myxococcota bacterium]|nr:CBS domain-containing protein [Myxococcota bacterium]